jgi:threonine/homoserine/homoserine lactone efflux protein
MNKPLTEVTQRRITAHGTVMLVVGCVYIIYISIDMMGKAKQAKQREGTHHHAH